MTICIVFAAVKMLNFFPPKGGVSAILSPRTIISGETLDYNKHLALRNGQYCQVHEEDNPRNSHLPRKRGAIALGPGGNLQGSFKCMALNSGKKITRRNWDVITMPDTVINRVNELGANQPEQLVFTDRRGRVIGDVQIPGVDPIDATPVEPCDDDKAIVDIPDMDVELQGLNPDVDE